MLLSSTKLLHQQDPSYLPVHRILLRQSFTSHTLHHYILPSNWGLPLLLLPSVSQSIIMFGISHSSHMAIPSESL
ncbi:unnamed protein product, partial [Nezara viridula]